MNIKGKHFGSKQIDVFIMYIIIFATDSFMVYRNVNETPKLIFRLIMMSLIAFYLFQNSKLRLNRLGCITLMKLAIVFVSVILCRDFSAANITMISSIVLGALIVRSWSYYNFRSQYVACMTFIALFSLVTYIVRPILLQLTFLPKVSNDGIVLVNLLFTNLAPSIFGTLTRNWGPFWEPGVFQAYLNIALYFTLKDNTRNIYKIVIILAIVTTFSTTGYICTMLILLSYAIENGYLRKKRKPISAILLIIVALVLVFVFRNQIWEIVFEKLNTTSLRYESTRSRIESVSGNIYAIANGYMGGLFGSGISKFGEAFSAYMKSKGFITYSNTNGFLISVAAYGIVYGLILLYTFFCYAKTESRKLLSIILVFLTVMIMFSTEPYVQSLFFNTFILYGLKSERKELTNTSENLMVN